MDKLYTTLLFDLDGTLTDPKLGITRSVQYALNKFGIHIDRLDALIPFIGPPLLESFQVFYGFEPEKSREAVAYYREYFQQTGIYENAIFPEIPALLTELQSRGKSLLVATSKPTVFAEEVCRHFHIDHFFRFIAGSNLDGSRTVKAEVIAYALEHAPRFQRHQVLMIGDRKHDIIGAAHHQIDSLAVTYGYGSRQELADAQPTYIVDSVAGIAQIVK
ncbi:MAG TPA: HAD family hydrolase [Patescibacteria group bacterium]|nr:HAD family hydrolase [Patescibacteria group bacterium]